jgi:proline iminopeptidase
MRFQRLVIALSLAAVIVASTFVVAKADAGQLTCPASLTLAEGEHVANVNGVKLWYKVAGSGPALLFPSTGWGASSDLYFKSLNRLEHLFTVVYIDTRGSGRSGKPAPDAPYSFEQFADDVDALRSSLGIKSAWVFGHSMGGMIAIDYCIRYASSCEGLVVVTTSPSITDSEYNTAANAAKATVANQPWYAAADAASQEFHIPLASDEEFAQLLDRIRPFYFYDQANIQVMAPAFVGTTYSAFAANLVYSHPIPTFSADDMARITVPTVVVEGVDDLIVPPSQAERVFNAVRNAHLVRVPKAGHFPWLEQPSAFWKRLGNALGSWLPCS